MIFLFHLQDSFQSATINSEIDLSINKHIRLQQNHLPGIKCVAQEQHSASLHGMNAIAATVPQLCSAALLLNTAKQTEQRGCCTVTVNKLPLLQYKYPAAGFFVFKYLSTGAG